MQFHPTVLMVNGISHLITEAVRGEGAYMRNHAGERFMPRYSELAELAPRDVVARAVLSEMLAEQTDCQYLDLRHLPSEKMHTRFPTISAFCRQNGLDLATDLLPVAPAAHFCMGGVLVDTEGRTTLPGLYAVGEVSCTGVHGANRLASNSLLEGLVYGVRIADHLTASAVLNNGHTNSYHVRKGVSMIIYDSVSGDEVPSSGNANEQSLQEIRGELRRLMWQYVALRREREGLLTARDQVKALQAQVMKSGDEEHQLSPRIAETTNMLQIAELVIAAALGRRESRGSHWRSDYQATDDLLAGRHYAFQRSRIDPYGLSFRHKEVRRHV
jgi:L-aspartate oxidase